MIYRHSGEKTVWVCEVHERGWFHRAAAANGIETSALVYPLQLIGQALSTEAVSGTLPRVHSIHISQFGRDECDSKQKRRGSLH